MIINVISEQLTNILRSDERSLKSQFGWLSIVALLESKEMTKSAREKSCWNIWLFIRIIYACTRATQVHAYRICRPTQYLTIGIVQNDVH